VAAFAKASVLEPVTGSIISAVSAHGKSVAGRGGLSGGPRSGNQSGAATAKKPQPKEIVSESDEGIDYTKIPGRLDQSFQELDEDHALHSTIIDTSNHWTKTSQKAL